MAKKGRKPTYRLRIFAAFHGREYVTRLFINHIKWLREQSDLPLPITAVCSDEADWLLLNDLLDAPGDKLVQAPNYPVSQKHNIGMQALLSHATETHVLHLGSDDLISLEFLERIHAERPDYAGLNGCHFADLKTHKAVFYKYYRNDIIGAGRVMSIEMLRQTIGSVYICRRPYYGWKVRDEVHIPDRLADAFCKRGVLMPSMSDEAKRCAMWPGAIDKGLDNLSNSTLRDLGFTPEIWEAEADRVDLVDLKSFENITSFERISHQSDAVAVDYTELVEKITPYETR